MAEKPKKKRRDLNEKAFDIVKEATKEQQAEDKKKIQKKDRDRQ